MVRRPASLGHFCDREGSLLRHQKRRLMRRRNSRAAPLPDQDTRASFFVPIPPNRWCIVKKALVALLGALVLVATVAIIRTLQFASRQPQVAPVATEPLDSLALAGRLAGAVRFRTISYQDSSQFDAREFDGLHRYLRDSFPRLHAALALEKVNGYGLLYRWAGSDSSLAPILLLAHQDVVPVEPGTEGRWTEPPFAGRISAGFVWGRGALDDKGSLLAIVEAVEHLIAAALTRLESQQMPIAVGGPTAAMFDYLGPELPFGARLVMANRWLLGGVLANQFGASPQGRALLRTTTAPTVVQAGVKENVLPSTARALVNFRILPGDSVGGVVAHVRDVVHDSRITVRALPTPVSDPSPVASPESESFALLARTIRQVVPGTVVTPWLVVGATDSRHYASLTPNVYRFVGIRIGQDDLKRIHGTDERVGVRAYVDAVRIYVQLLRNGAM